MSMPGYTARAATQAEGPAHMTNLSRTASDGNHIFASAAAEPLGDWRAEVERLAALHPVEYDRERKAAQKVIGCQLSTLDAEVAALRAPVYAAAPGGQGRPLEWPEPELYDVPVNGSRMLDDLAGVVSDHVELPPEHAAAIALWIVHAWLHDRLEISTFLNITSATKRCGKSLLLEVIAEFVPRPLNVGAALTPAALFRAIEAAEPTLLLDEVDTYLREAPELRGALCGSQRRSSACAIRCVGDDFEPRAFSTWAPKVFAGIGGMPDTVLDRSIVITMERRSQTSRKLWRDRNPDVIADVVRKIARWSDDNGGRVVAAFPAVAFPAGLHDRARDAWESLLAIGEVAGGEWTGANGRAARAAAYIVAAGDGDDGDSARELLIADLRAVFAADDDPTAMTTANILGALNDMEGRPWPEWGRAGKPLTSRGLARLLAGFKVRPGTIRLPGGGTIKGYKRSAFASVWESYVNLSVTTSQPPVSAAFGDSLSVTTPDRVTDGNPPKAPASRTCDGVTDRNPGSPAEDFEL